MTWLRLQVVDVRTGVVQDVVLSEDEGTLLALQHQRHLERNVPHAFTRWLAMVIETAVPSLVDYDLRPPTEAQVRFATAIARALHLPLAPEVLRYRGPMHEFLNEHKEAFNERRNSGGARDDQVG